MFNKSIFQQSLIEQIKDIKEKAQLIFDSDKSNKFKISLEPKKWSVIEHLDHMNNTMSNYFLEIDKALATARVDVVEIYKPGFFAKQFIKLLEPPPRIKLRTFKIFTPGKEKSIDKVNETFFNLRNDFLKRVEQVSMQNMLKTRMSSPASKYLKFEIGEAFLILTSHDRRHLYTITNIMNKL